ncbi:MAG: DnaJ domain-containing protein [Alphaproteobacteria bacterium]
MPHLVAAAGQGNKVATEAGLGKPCRMPRPARRANRRHVGRLALQPVQDCRYSLIMARKRTTSTAWEEEQLRLERRPCDIPNCAGHGEFRAPKSRERLQDYFWFCLDHVRAYNQTWDYFSGMSEADIERHIRFDTTWQRPTWPLSGPNGRLGALGGDPRLRAAMNAFHAAFAENGEAQAGSRRRMEDEDPVRARWRRMSAEAEKALAVMELEPPVSLSTLKARYKTLVKRHHPDANGGDKMAEERLKTINQAYVTLKSIVADLSA